MTALVVLVVLVVGGTIGGLMFGIPHYRVWQREKAGMAELKQAEWNRQIRIREAMAEEEAAKALAQAEIERARGVAEANRIIGESLAGNEAYLRYLWVQGLNSEHTKVVYVPTEAQLPILEATRGLQK
jgi:regulator of protease activity HflC (stomatin/prohibitin superfamily)